MQSVTKLKQKLDILFQRSFDGDEIEKLRNENNDQIIEIVDTCITIGDDNFQRIFSWPCHKKSFLIIMRLGLHLFNDLQQLNLLQCNHLYNIGTLIIRIIHHIRTMNSNIKFFFNMFFDYEYKSQSLSRMILQHIQHIQHPSLMRILFRWLDIFSHHHYVIGNTTDRQEEYLNQISAHIIERKDYLLNDLNSSGSSFFFLSFSLDLPATFEEADFNQWCGYVTCKSKELSEWSSDTLHRVMGIVHIITHRSWQGLVKYDEEYCWSLLNIITDIELQKFLTPTLINDESILIHCIIIYFLIMIERDDRVQHILRTATQKLRCLRQFVKCQSTRMNLSYLILATQKYTTETSDKTIPSNSYGSDNYNSQEIQKMWTNFADKDLSPAIIHFIVEIFKKKQRRKLRKNYCRFKKDDKLPKYLNLCIETLEDACCCMKISRHDQFKVLFTAYMDHDWRRLMKKRILGSIIANKFSRSNSGIRMIEGYSPLSHEKLIENDLVISCSPTFSPDRLQLCFKNNKFSIMILNDCINGEQHEECILGSKSLLSCIDKNYIERLPELIFAYKHQLPIIPIIVDEDEEYKTNDPFLTFILDRYQSSSKVIHLKDFKQKTIDELSSQINSTLIPMKVITSMEDLYKASRKNDIKTVQQYLKHMDVSEIDQRRSNGSTALHVASYYGRNEIVRLLLEAGASPSIINTSNGLTPFGEARVESTRDVFRLHDDTYRNSIENVPIQWIHVSSNPNALRKRLQMKLYQLQVIKNDNKEQMYKDIVDSLKRFVNRSPLSSEGKRITMDLLSQLQETLNPAHFIRCYVNTTNFYRYFNKLLARHSIDFFDSNIIDINADYRTIKNFLRITALVMNDHTFDDCRWCGTTYRGMLMTNEDLSKYILNSKFVTSSWLSTSRDRNIAEDFCQYSHDDEETFMQKVLCIYTTKNKKTALNIDSFINDDDSEREVIIFPFSVFKVTGIRYAANHHAVIFLEEVMEDEADDDFLLKEPS